MLKSQVNHALGPPAYAGGVMETMGSRIKSLRDSRKLSQEQMGKIVGVTGASISQWESGSVKNIRPEHFLRFCAYFEADPFWVVFGPDGPKGPSAGKSKPPFLRHGKPPAS